MSLEDDFVAFGGTSLSAACMFKRLNEEFDTDFDFAMLAAPERATIASVAACVDEAAMSASPRDSQRMTQSPIADLLSSQSTSASC